MRANFAACNMLWFAGWMFGSRRSSCGARAISDAMPNTLDLLAQLERYETSGFESDAQRLVQLRSELMTSNDMARRELARRLDIHYRNANVRFAITAALMNRLLPEPKPSSEQVNEMIFGAAVHGDSTTSAALAVELIPDRQQWQFNLVTKGNVDSHTYTTHGPATFESQNQATYDVRKHVVIDPTGLHVAPAMASVNNSGDLTGLRTSYDGVPLLRAIVRNYAISKHDQKIAEANREAELSVAAKATQRIDEQAGAKVVEAEANLNRSLIDPLRRLSLDPTAVAMETTAARLVLRSRIAGSDQLAANTARPAAPSDSLASVQIHASAINNLLEHLELGGRTFTLPELHKWLTDKLGRGDAKAPSDLPDDVQVNFAQYNPVRVRFENNRMELILNITEIHQGKHRWREFEVRAAYRPVMNGLATALERDGVIELGGLYQGKPELALRGIFSKVLSRERKIELIPAQVVADPRLAGLEVTQVAIEDGWIALAIGPGRATAARPVGAAKR